MKFELKKNVPACRDNGQIFLRLKDEKVLEAFKKAQADSNKSAANLAHEMIVHCLKDSGYLK